MITITAESIWNEIDERVSDLAHNVLTDRLDSDEFREMILELVDVRGLLHESTLVAMQEQIRERVSDLAIKHNLEQANNLLFVLTKTLGSTFIRTELAERSSLLSPRTDEMKILPTQEEMAKARDYYEAILLSLVQSPAKNDNS